MKPILDITSFADAPEGEADRTISGRRQPEVCAQDYHPLVTLGMQ